MKRFILLLQLSLLFATLLYGQNNSVNYTVTLNPNSEISIVVFTNLFSFDLKQKGDEILKEPIEVDATFENNEMYITQNQLPLTIKNFKSDNKMAQRDFYKLLNADEYPYMLLEVENFSFVKKNNLYTGEVLMNITISDVVRKYRIPISVDVESENVIIKGKKRISIRDYGLEPPTALMGMIRVGEWIEINFGIDCLVEPIR